MFELLLHVLVKLLKILLEGIIFQVVVDLKVVVGQDALVDKPDGEGIAEYRTKLLQQIESEGGAAVPIGVEHPEEGVEVVLAKGTQDLVLHHRVRQGKKGVDVVLGRSAGPLLEGPPLGEAAVQKAEVEPRRLPLDPPKAVHRLGTGGERLKLGQPPAVCLARHPLPPQEGPRVSDLGADDLARDPERLPLGEGVLPAADLGDGVSLGNKASPVSAKGGEVVQDDPVLVRPSYEGGREVYVPEDVDRVHLTHGKGTDLALAGGEDDDPTAFHPHLRALLRHVNDAVVE